MLDQEPLSEQHIQQLLAEAEQRLDTTQAKASKGRADLRFEGFFVDIILDTNLRIALCRFPKLQTGVVSRLYVVSNGAITRVDSGRLIRHGEKEHSSTPRRVEDPVVIKETMKKVSFPSTILAVLSLSMRKINPISSLMQNYRSRIGYRSVFMRVYIKHSYSEAHPCRPISIQHSRYTPGC